MRVALAGLDRRALLLARTRLHRPLAEHVARTYALAGEYGALWVSLALAGAAVDPARRRRWLSVAASIPVALVSNYGVKVAVRRRRPRLRGLAPLARAPATYSFPSGHAATAFAGAHGVGALHAPLRLPLLVAAALMGLTRPYLGLHYPSDVLAGAALGTAVGHTLAAAWRRPAVSVGSP